MPSADFRSIRKMTLKEISFVDLAADEHTSAVIEAQLEDKDNLEMTNSSENKTGHFF